MNRQNARKRAIPKKISDLSDFKNIYNGQKCFVVGAGPSLAFLDLSKIHNHVVISVNSSALLMPWKDGSSDRRFWVSNDTLCLRWDYFWTHVLKTKSTKIVRTSWKKHDEDIRNHNFRYFSPRKSDSIIDDSVNLCSTSSIPTAIDFAIYMGCSSICLLGVDHQMVHGNSHFWQFWNKKKWPQRSDKDSMFRPEQSHQIKVFKQNVIAYKSLNKYATSKNIEIFNCSSRSKIDVFPKISLEKALNE